MDWRLGPHKPGVGSKLGRVHGEGGHAMLVGEGWPCAALVDLALVALCGKETYRVASCGLDLGRSCLQLGPSCVGPALAGYFRPTKMG